MSGYNTKQRRALLAFLGEHPDELLTARQMADALAEKQISLSAVYRNLAQLEAQKAGRTKRFISILTPRAARARCT